VKLDGDGPEQAVRFPPSSVRRLQLTYKADEGPADATAMLTLSNEDMLVGSLAGTLNLDTAFSTITMNAGEVKRLVKMPGSPSDVQVVLWDETTVSGQLQEQEVLCKLESGIEMKVPVALVRAYAQPRPMPSAQVVEAIKGLVAELSADDWKARDGAQDRLTTMGPVVIATLQQIRPSQTPEAQQRIDLILKQVQKDGAKEKSTPSAPPPPALIEE
jgi:hypothetical protein